jgi:hypothetical protein
MSDQANLDTAVKAMNDANMSMLWRNVHIDNQTAASKAAKNKS